MYKKPFYITKDLWNNALSYIQRDNKQLYVPSLIKSEIPDIKLGNKVVFEDFDFDDKLSSCTWLENFYEIDWNWKKIFLFDNHNHAYYFWYLARNKKIIWDDNILYHVDEHSDMRDTDEYLLKPDSYDLEKVFNYTNFKINVWNYIIPAQKEGIIKDIIQIRNEENLNTYLHNLNLPFPKGVPWKGEGLEKIEWITNNKLWLSHWTILNLDLDFFQPDLDFIDYELKKKVVLDIANKADIITVATSPFFIKQDLALKVFKDLFWLFSKS